jgi:hypothetical protein
MILFAGSRDTHRETGNRHDCLPSPQLAGRWEQMKWNSVRWGNKYIVLCRLEHPRQGQKSLSRHNEPNEPKWKNPLYVLPKSKFISVSQSAGGPPLSSLFGAMAHSGHTCMLLVSQKNGSMIFKNVTINTWNEHRCLTYNQTVKYVDSVQYAKVC